MRVIRPLQQFFCGLIARNRQETRKDKVDVEGELLVVLTGDLFGGNGNGGPSTEHSRQDGGSTRRKCLLPSRR